MEESLSPSEKLAIRRVMEDTIMAAGSFHVGEVGSRVIMELWPKIAEAVEDGDNFADTERACERLIAEALVAARKKVSADDREYAEELMDIVMQNARETYCKLRGVPCEVKDISDEDEKGRAAEVIHVDFGRRPSI